MEDLLGKVIRDQEYPNLKGTTYLDHAGTTIPARSLINRYAHDLASNLFGNPHSASPASEYSTRRVERVRRRCLSYFKADPEHFDLIFVANATAAIKLVMESMRDYSQDPRHPGISGFHYSYHKDCHNSVVGVREIAKGSKCFTSDDQVNLWLAGASDASIVEKRIKLFAYPAQSNLNGHRCSLAWPGRLRRSDLPQHKDTYSLLDAAAYVSTCQLDLSNIDDAPDFTALSFYKIFGFPDLGALIVRKDAGHVLLGRRYFGGGTVDMVLALDDAWHVKKTEAIHSQLEDGTLPFHTIIALDSAMDVQKMLYGSMDRISQHTGQLSKLMHDQLSSLRYTDGISACEIYKDPYSTYGDSKTQGATIAFNVRNCQGGWVGKSDFEQLAISHNIQLRTGGVCNPGGIASFLDLAHWELRRNFAEGLRCGNNIDIIGGKPTGIIRASLGAMSTTKDVMTLVKFVKDVIMEEHAGLYDSKLPPRLRPKLETLFEVESVTVFPIIGCTGWTPPPTVPWEIKADGLVYDQEWGLVSLHTGLVLNPHDYPRMNLLKPSIDIKAGTLRIDTDHEDLTIPKSINVSLWDVLPKSALYKSEKIMRFFSTVVGAPCTLARFRMGDNYDLPVRITDQAHERGRPIRNPLQFKTLQNSGSIILRILPSSQLEGYDETNNAKSTTPSPVANITLRRRHAPEDYTLAENDNDWSYIQVGPHYFQAFNIRSEDPQTRSQDCITLKHLPAIQSGAVSAQYPTIQAGESAFTIPLSFGSTGTNVVSLKTHEGLQSCIAALFQVGFFCRELEAPVRRHLGFEPARQACELYNVFSDQRVGLAGIGTGTTILVNEKFKNTRGQKVDYHKPILKQAFELRLWW